MTATGYAGGGAAPVLTAPTVAASATPVVSSSPISPVAAIALAVAAIVGYYLYRRFGGHAEEDGRKDADAGDRA